LECYTSKIRWKNDLTNDSTHLPPRPAASLVAHIPQINPPGSVPVVTTTTTRLLPSSPLINDITQSQLSINRYGTPSIGGNPNQKRISGSSSDYYRQTVPPQPSVPTPFYDDERFAHYEMANFR